MTEAVSSELSDWTLDALRGLLPTDATVRYEGAGRISVNANLGGAASLATEFMLAFDEAALRALSKADERQRLVMAGRLKSEVAGALLRGLEYEARAGRVLCVDVNSRLLALC